MGKALGKALGKAPLFNRRPLSFQSSILLLALNLRARRSSIVGKRCRGRDRASFGERQGPLGLTCLSEEGWLQHGWFQWVEQLRSGRGSGQLAKSAGMTGCPFLWPAAKACSCKLAFSIVW